MRPGYLVGCQVNLGGGRVGGRDGSLRLSDGTIDDYDLYGGARNTLSLGPGEVAGSSSTTRRCPTSSVPIAISGSHLRRREVGSRELRELADRPAGCAGYAQARSWLLVIVETEFAQESFNFYGRPFSWADR